MVNGQMRVSPWANRVRPLGRQSSGQTMAKQWSNHGQAVVKPWPSSGQIPAHGDGQIPAHGEGARGGGGRYLQRYGCGPSDQPLLALPPDAQVLWSNHGQIMVK